MRHLVCIAAIFYSGLAFSQSSRVNCFFGQDTITADRSPTFSNKLHLVNLSNEQLVLVNVPVKTNSQALLFLPDTLILAAHATRMIPVKYLANGGSDVITVRMRITGTVQEDIEASFMLRQPAAEKLIIRVPAPLVYLEQGNRDNFIGVHFSNKASTSLSFNLSAAVAPAGIQVSGYPGTLLLAGLEDRIVQFKINTPVKLTALPDFVVTLLATDQAGKTLATCLVKLIPVSSSRVAATSAFSTGDYLNQVAVTWGNTSLGASYYQFGTEGRAFSEEGSKFDYRVHFNYYQQQSGVEAYDSQLSYNGKKMGIQLGSISETLDYPVFGQGIKLSAGTERRGVDGYYLKNTYLLYSQLNKATTVVPDIIGLSYRTRNKEGLGSTVGLLRIHDPGTGQLNRLITMSSSFRLSAHQILKLVGGYSLESLTERKGAADGMSAGWGYSADFSKWTINLDNYYSTPYYSGLKRGALQLEERLNYAATSGAQFFLRYSKIANTPQYLQPAQHAGNYLNTAIYEAGFNCLPAPGLSLGFRPYLFSQALNEYQDVDLHQYTNLRSTAMRSVMSISKNGNAASASLQADVGYTRTNNPVLSAGNYFSSKITASLTGRSAGLAAIIQSGAYFLSDEFTGVTAGNRYHSYSVSSYFKTYLPKLRLEVQLSPNVNYYGAASSWNRAADLQLNYRAGGWSIKGQAYFSKSNQPGFLQTWLTLQKQFRTGVKPGKLSLSFFADNNVNGRADHNEPPLPGILVQAGGYTATTNAKGIAEFTGLTAANNAVIVVDGKGLSMSYPVNIKGEKQEKIAVPLVKSSLIYGSINVIKQPYEQKEPVLEGIRVNAVDSLGHTYSTLTDEKGAFILRVPANRYNVFVPHENMWFQVKDQGKKNVDVTVLRSATLSFDLLDNRRKVDIARF